MHARAPILLIVLAFGSLAASRVMDDETLLKDPDRYNPYPPRDSLRVFTDKINGIQFCVLKGLVWREDSGICSDNERPEAKEMRQLEERYQQLRAVRERLQRMTTEDRLAFEEKRRNQFLSEASRRWLAHQPPVPGPRSFPEIQRSKAPSNKPVELYLREFPRLWSGDSLPALSVPPER